MFNRPTDVTMHSDKKCEKSQSSDKFYPSKRAKIINWIWLIYNAFALVALSYKSYSGGIEMWGKVCALFGLLTAFAFTIKCFSSVNKSAPKQFMSSSFSYIILGHVLGAASLWGNGLSLSILATPLFLAIFFVNNESFTEWSHKGS